MTKRIMLMTLAIISLIAITVAAVETVPGTEKPGAPRFVNLDSAKAASAKDGRPIVLDFYAEW